ncbi:MAG: WbuC family cupin fold metalloprotein [Xanthobacteraceae bacterium]|jgi:cupin fold WbuC family metalloprotein
MPELEQVRIVAQSQISDLASEAETAPRRRTHLLLHSGPQDQVQRLMIVLQPGTYIRPHHHSEQWELVVLLQGRGDLLRFDGSGCLADRIELSTRAQVAQIPAGVWHGFVVREKDTAVLEIKPGPYRSNEFVDWAPEEGAPDASRMVEWLSTAKLGSDWAGMRG